MNRKTLIATLDKHLHELCERYPDRSPGSEGNQSAVKYFAQIAAQLGHRVSTTVFECLDWESGPSWIQTESQTIPLHPGPYGAGCDLRAPLIAVSEVSELDSLKIRGKVVLIHGELAREPIMPRDYVFYNPEEHRELYRILDHRMPAAIIAATGINPGLCAAQSPFPLFEDGKLSIPTLYTDEATGTELLKLVGQEVGLVCGGRRIHSTGEQVVVRVGDDTLPELVFCCHIDSKKGSPGALDNAGGTAVLLGLLEMLKEYRGRYTLEFVPFNGEDSWSPYGEMIYLGRKRFPNVKLAVNLDGVGDPESLGAWFGFSLTGEQRTAVGKVFSDRKRFVEGDPWVQGDHSMFVMKGVPAVAVSSARMEELWRLYAHTPLDTVDRVDSGRLADLVLALKELPELL